MAIERPVTPSDYPLAGWRRRPIGDQVPSQRTMGRAREIDYRSCVIAPDQVTLAPKGFFADDLARHGTKVALLTATDTVTYEELARRAQSVADQLAGRRRLVLLASANSVESIVGYLGALRAGHVVLLVDSDSPENMISAYDPDSVITVGGKLRIQNRREEPGHELHPDLALLLSTSGTTGSPKLVRLSYTNLQSNAKAIADYLGIGESDRAITTLPMHYCYGLSVVHSHLLQGAGLIVSDHSVADAAFWDLLNSRGATSFAAVPHSFDLLDRIGFSEMSLPALRYITQAGGRLDPARVRRFAELGQANGWDLFVMYGQTEATARMAYLPPHLAATHPQAIGIPIPGGSFHLDPMTDGTTELVYSGPNVMLGYATSVADLAAGRTVHELRTGDLARLNADGLYEIVGRTSRFLKLFGLRVDLEQVELMLAERGVTAACAGSDAELVVAVEEPAKAQGIRDAIATRYHLPHHVVTVHSVKQLPRLASGKPDYAAIRALATEPEAAPKRVAKEEAVCDLYARMLGIKSVQPADTFTELGGDSLTYVAISMQLEKLIGPLPADWPNKPIRDLAGKRRRFATVDTSVLLRACAIVFVLGTHLEMFVMPGGAQLMLAVAAYNFARFQLSEGTSRVSRVKQVLRSVLRIYVPAVAVIAAVLVAFDEYSPVNLLMANYLAGTDNANAEWHFWFLETLIYYLIACAAFLATPWGDRLERRFPFALPLTFLATGPLMAFGLQLTSPSQYNRLTPVMLFWIFAVGWAAAKATRIWHRLLISGVLLLTVPEFFLSQQRAMIVLAGLLLLVWVQVLPSIRLVNVFVGTIASGSLYIYLTHWQIYPRLEQRGMPAVLILVVCLAIGVAYGEAVRRAFSGEWLATGRAWLARWRPAPGTR